MTKVPLRTRFLTLLLVGVLAVTCATLLLVRHTIENQVRVEISASLGNSVSTFNALQAEREHNLGRSAELLADLPTVKALMTTQDVTTIQDASLEIWRLSGQDLLVLAAPEGKIMAVHAASRDLSSVNVQDSLDRSLLVSSSKQWWFVGGHLYEVFFQPIYFGPSTGNRVLGVLALGYEINGQVAKDVSRITGSHVAFLYGDSVVAGTIVSARWPELVRSFRNAAESHSISAQDLQLGEERYLATSVEVAPGTTPRIRLGVLKSYDEATARFQE